MCMQHIQELHVNPALMCGGWYKAIEFMGCSRSGAIMSRRVCRQHRADLRRSHRVKFCEKPRGPQTAHSNHKTTITIVIYIDTSHHKSYETCFRCRCEDLYQRDAIRNRAPERLKMNLKLSTRRLFKWSPFFCFFHWQLYSKGKHETSCLARPRRAASKNDKFNWEARVRATAQQYLH